MPCNAPRYSAAIRSCFRRVLPSSTPERGESMRKLLVTATLVSVLLLGLAGIAFANPTPNQPGQPGQSCGSQSALIMPGGGNSSTSSGSPFQGASSAGVYANGPGTGGPGTATG